MGRHRAEKVERRGKRPLIRAVASALGLTALGLGFSAANESHQSPDIGIVVYSDCTESGINIGERVQPLSHAEKKVSVDDLVYQEQSELCRAAGNVASNLLFKYYNRGNQTLEDGQKISVDVADENKDGKHEVTVKDSRMYGGEVLSLTAEATKVDDNKWELGELQEVAFRYDANFGSVEYSDGTWSTFTMAANDKGWPSAGFGFVHDIASAQEKLQDTREFVRTMNEVDQSTYTSRPYL